MAFSTAPGKMLGGLETRDHCALELFAPELIHESGTVQICTEREKGEVLRQTDLRVLHYIFAHLSVTAVRNSVVRTSCRTILSGNTKPRCQGYPGGSVSNRIYLAVTLPFLDASLSPISLAEQPPSSSALRTTLCAWVSPLPRGRSASPIVPSERG